MSTDPLPYTPPEPRPETIADYAQTTLHTYETQEGVLYGHPRLLGRAAVSKATEHANLVIAEGQGEEEVIDQLGAEYAVEGLIEAARERLDAIPEERKQEMADILNLSELPEALRAAVSVGEDAPSNLTLMEALTAKGDKGKFKVGDATMLNVLQYHNDRMSKRQIEFDRHEGPRHKARFKHLIAKAVDEEKLPPEAMNNADNVLYAKLYLDDGFNTTAIGREGYITRYGIDHQTEMILSPITDDETVTHELGHIIVGMDESKMPLDGEATLEFLKTHEREELAELTGLHRIWGVNAMANLIEEAIDEHITLMLERAVTTIDPRDPSHNGRAYEVGGFVWLRLCTAGRKPIDPMVFLEAYFANGDRTVPELVTLERELHEAFPGRDFAAEFAALEPREGQHIARLAYAYAVEELVSA